MAPSIENRLKSLIHGTVADQPSSLFDGMVSSHKKQMDDLIKNQGDENPYELHQELGDWMTRQCTVVRNNKDLTSLVEKIDELKSRYERVSIADQSNWTNQNFSFTRAVGDMILLGRVIAEGALRRDECRGAHYKPEFAIPAPDATDADVLRKQAEQWCKVFKIRNDKWLMSTVAKYTPDGPEFRYEKVDTSLIPPRPRTYGLTGAEIIEQLWREMDPSSTNKPVSAASS